MQGNVLRFCLCIGIIVALVGVIPSQGFPRVRRGMRLCGSQLSQALAMICDSVYYVPRSIRSPALPFKNEAYWHEVSSLNSEQMRSPNVIGIIGSPDTMNLFPRNKDYFKRQTRQGIVDECCKKSCSIDELRAYCGPTELED